MADDPAGAPPASAIRRRRRPCGLRSAAIILAACALVAASPRTGTQDGGTGPWPVGYGTRTVDERLDPWTVVTDATVAPLLTPAQRRVHRRRRVVVDYDKDGVQDVAWMVRNRTQMGVLVRLGATGRTVLAFRADGAWSDQSLMSGGRNDVVVEFPESTIVSLSGRSGRPLVYYADG